MLKIKTIVASLMAAATVSTVGITASAYSNPDYKFDIKYAGSYAWSDAAVKEDSTIWVDVITTGGTVSSQKLVYVTTYSNKMSNNKYRETNTGILNNNGMQIALQYEDNVPHGKNSTHYLRGDAGDYAVTAEGYWNP